MIDDPQVGEDWETMLAKLTDAQVAIGRNTMILTHKSNFAPAPAEFLAWATVDKWHGQLGKEKEEWNGMIEVSEEYKPRMRQLADVIAGKIKLPKNGTAADNRAALGWPQHEEQR